MKWLSLLLFAMMASQAFAITDFPAEARLFLGSVNVKPTEVNNELTAQGLKNYDTLGELGVEITYPALRFLEVGFRYTKRDTLRYEVNPTANDYQAEISQDAVLALARIPFLKTNLIRLDVFGGAGGTNTSLKIKSATNDGELSRKAASDWFATPYAAYGASIAIGWKHFYLVVEGGMESNKVGGLKHTGTITNNINTIDLSGSYFTVGFLFDGITAHKE